MHVNFLYKIEPNVLSKVFELQNPYKKITEMETA
jgi:hypothetical protein